MNCTIDTCEKPAWAKGLCPMHLRRLRVHGDPNYTTRIPNGEKLRWLTASVSEETEDCIIWPFKVGNHGYGTLNYDKSYMLAHHVVLILHNRSLPIGLEETRHTCDNKRCVNNRHLIVGTPKDNAQDRVKAGTTNPGSKRRNAKLTEDDVIKIRETPEYWGVCTALAKKYEVSVGLISSIRRMDQKRWNHV